MNKDQLLQHWASAGVFDFTEVGGVLCGLNQYMFTCAIVIDLKPMVMGRRYCYPTYEDAVEAYRHYTDTNAHPTGPWIKCKGSMNGKQIDLLNPEIDDPYRTE